MKTYGLLLRDDAHRHLEPRGFGVPMCFNIGLSHF
jgi:hypothetical protein